MGGLGFRLSRRTTAPTGSRSSTAEVPKGYKRNPAAEGGKRFKTASGEMANVNPYQRKASQYNPNFNPFGKSGGTANPSAGGGGGLFGGGAPVGQFSGGGGGGGGWSGGGAGGWSGGGGGRAAGSVNVTSESSPALEEAAQAWEAHQAKIDEAYNKTDENLQEQIRLYRERMGEGPTTRAIERAGSTIRDFAAGQAEEAKRMGAMGGRGAGLGATGIAESAQRAQAGAAADISLGREQDLDRLLMGGQNIMAAPGQRQERLLGQGGQHFAYSPYQDQANYALGSQGLGLEALRLENQMNPQMNPFQMFQMLFPGGVY